MRATVLGGRDERRDGRPRPGSARCPRPGTPLEHPGPDPRGPRPALVPETELLTASAITSEISHYKAKPDHCQKIPDALRRREVCHVAHGGQRHDDEIHHHEDRNPICTAGIYPATP